MPVRDACYTDVPHLIGLIAEFYAEAPYAAPDVNELKAAAVLQALIAAQNEGSEDVFVHVIDQGGGLRGMVIAERVTDLWSDAPTVFEYFVYVRRQFRGGPSAGRLMLTFKRWAEAKPGHIRAQASSGIDDTGVYALYEKLGWGERGRIYGAEII